MNNSALPQPGQVAWLKVVAVNDTGTFLAWGRPKDLLLPFREQPRETRVTPGEYCLVCILLDADDRPFATMRLDRWIKDTAEGYRAGDPVTLVVAGRTDLGLKVVVDHRYWGLLHAAGLTRPVQRGDTLPGWIRQLREDGKLDVTIDPPAHKAAAELTTRILDALQEAGGRLPLGDRSPPEAIRDAFGVSKGVFKQAIGALYRQRQIRINDDSIEFTGGKD